MSFKLKIPFIQNKKRLLVVADDFGMSQAINDGIYYTIKHGFTTDISFMVYGEAAQQAIKLTEKHNLENIGIHITLQGIYPKIRRLRLKDYEEIFRTKTTTEIIKAAQKELNLFEKLVGKKPTHINTHQGLHGNLKLLQFLIVYAKENNIPMRIPNTTLDNSGLENQNYTAEILLERNRIRKTDYLFAQISGADIQRIKNHFMDNLSRVRKGESAEILFHPGFVDEKLLEITSMTYERARDIAILIDKDFWRKVKELGFKFIHYNQI